jgi:Ca2+-binding RTX toxin-like protein
MVSMRSSTVARLTSVAALALVAVALPAPSYAKAPRVVFEHGRLLVVGDGQPNSILVVRRASGVRVKIDGRTVEPDRPIRLSALAEVVVVGGGGGDVISLRERHGALPKVTLNGGRGDDRLTGGKGNFATLVGGGGDDVLQARSGLATLDGGAGDDRLTGGWTQPFTGVLGPQRTRPTISGGPGADRLAAPLGPAVIHGDDGDDVIDAVSGGTTAFGDAGNDTVTGGGRGGIQPEGADLYGGDGNDTVTVTGVAVVHGGPGDDTLAAADGQRLDGEGGAGADTFRFGATPAATLRKDWIVDFAGGADTIDLSSGLSVRDGLGTPTVTIWDGVTDVGTITSANGGHLWGSGDFT